MRSWAKAQGDTLETLSDAYAKLEKVTALEAFTQGVCTAAGLAADMLRWLYDSAEE